MPRPRCRRNIGYLPEIKYFKPAGVRIGDLEEVILGHDEVEAMRLKDLIGLPQEEAAKEMNVSQSTFHRLILSAHQKLAETVIHGKALRIEGGNVAISEDARPVCGWRKQCRQGWKAANPENAKTQENITKGEPMIVAVTSIDGALTGMVDERFGRSKKIVLYDLQNSTFEVIDNISNMNSPQGAGIQTSQNVLKAKADAVISGHLGPNAFRVLQAAGIKAYTTSQMTVGDAISAFKAGKLPILAGADVEGHW